MFKTIGFPISHKENEKRRAFVPSEIKSLSHPELLFFEKGYGEILGIPDDIYKRAGCNIVGRDAVLKQNIICDPKIGDAEYLSALRKQTIFGWIHATQNRPITDSIVNGKLTAIAWEKMFDRGRHVFWRNNELAGEAAVLHAFQCYGKMPYETTVAVLGKGNTARGAIKVLNMLGAKVFQYDRKTEKLFREEISKYDVVVNCVLWDVSRDDHIVYRNDLRMMKTGGMIIDVSCDRHGGVESSVPTTIEKPTYYIDGVLHYAVDHTPTLFYKTFSFDNSKVIAPYIEMLSLGKTDNIVEQATIIKDGEILDGEIKIFQNRKKFL